MYRDPVPPRRNVSGPCAPPAQCIGTLCPPAQCFGTLCPPGAIQELYDEVSSQPKELPVTESTTHRDYNVKDFVPQTPQPSKEHDYHREEAVTFWTENKHLVQGVTDIRTTDTPFKRSSAFSAPISQCLDEPLPHSMERYPM
ncbi:sperm-associated antigen 8 [Discoglossus pictus]